MELGLGQKLFPGWSAALTLVKAHGVAAGGQLADAWRADTGEQRLGYAVRALTSFDHAIDNTRKLPVGLIVPGSGKYLAGYAAAKAAVDLLIASGIVPGARERVGVQQLAAARETFLAGIDVASSDVSRFGRKLATGWVDATVEDAISGVRMLAPSVGQELLDGIAIARKAVRKGNPVDSALVSRVTGLFDVASATLLAAAEQASVNAPVVRNDAAFARSGELLLEAQRGLDALLAGTPDPSVLDTYQAD